MDMIELKDRIDILQNDMNGLTALVHAFLEGIRSENISIDEIVNGINTGEIIKQYPDDKPLASCLILGFSVKSQYIHIVVSCDTDFIYLITAYFPDPDMWENDFKTRKGR